MQSAYRQAHALCIVRGEYVAEVARGYGKVNLLANLYLSAADKVEEAEK